MKHGRLDILLAELAHRSGVPLDLDDSGSCAVEYGDGAEIVISAVEDGEALLLQQPVQLLSRADLAEQLRRTLELSRYGAELAGAALGLDRQTDWIFLWQRLPVAAMRCDDLEQAILVFMGAAAHARQRLTATAPDHDAGIVAHTDLRASLEFLRA